MNKQTVALGVLAFLALSSFARAEDTSKLSACYKVTIGKSSFTWDGRLLLDQMRLAAGRPGGAGADDPIKPLLNSKKPNAKKCSGPTDDLLKNADLNSANSAFYGQISGSSTFRKMSEVTCSGAVGPKQNQFFMLGDVVLYRYCGGGDGNGYIYFWGLNEGKSSQCFGSAYPAMYSVLSDDNPKSSARPKLSLQDLRSAETRGNIGTLDAGGEALANEVAAELIAESDRDYNLKYLNYMLLDIESSDNAGAKNKDKISTSAILAGYCPPNVSKASCGNSDPNTYGLGIHPLAWGKAQAKMMSGGWGRANGATSDFGKNYEADLLERWLVINKSAVPAPAGSACVRSQSGPPPSPADSAAFVSLLNNTFYK